MVNPKSPYGTSFLCFNHGKQIPVSSFHQVRCSVSSSIATGPHRNCLPAGSRDANKWWKSRQTTFHGSRNIKKPSAKTSEIIHTNKASTILTCDLHVYSLLVVRMVRFNPFLKVSIPKPFTNQVFSGGFSHYKNPYLKPRWNPVAKNAHIPIPGFCL